MKIEKKHWAIIGVVVAIILVWYFFLRKKKCCGWDANGKCTTKCDPKTGAAPTTSPSESGYAGMYGSFGNESGFDRHDTTGGESTIGKSRPKGVLK